MAAVPEIDLTALTAPIPGDSPGGSRVPFTVRQKLEAGRKDSEPNPDDPTGAPIAKKPEWSAIIKQSVDTISKTSKDIETSLRLLEALTKVGYFPGMTRGLQAVKALVDNCWDHLHPIPDPADGEGPEIRADRFNWIGDMDAGARYPHVVREIPFLLVAGNKYSMADRQSSLDGKGPVTADEMSRATLSDAMFAEIDASYQAFFDLDRVLTERLQNNAPGMVGLRQVLEDIHHLAKKLSTGNSGGASGSEEQESGGAGADNATPQRSVGGAFAVNMSAVASREDAYRMISQIADALSRIEPHSPIPDLLHRAIELGRMPFRRLIKELVRDAGNLSQVYREFGIKEEDGSAG